MCASTQQKQKKAALVYQGRFKVLYFKSDTDFLNNVIVIQMMYLNLVNLLSNLILPLSYYIPVVG